VRGVGRGVHARSVVARVLVDPLVHAVDLSAGRHGCHASLSHVARNTRAGANVAEVVPADREGRVGVLNGLDALRIARELHWAPNTVVAEVGRVARVISIARANARVARSNHARAAQSKLAVHQNEERSVARRRSARLSDHPLVIVPADSLRGAHPASETDTVARLASEETRAAAIDKRAVIRGQDRVALRGAVPLDVLPSAVVAISLEGDVLIVVSRAHAICAGHTADRPGAVKRAKLDASRVVSARDRDAVLLSHPKMWHAGERDGRALVH
jgi:hypothetical protein